MRIIKFIFVSLAIFMSCLGARADEGMWLPSLIAQRIADMQEKVI